MKVNCEANKQSVIMKSKSVLKTVVKLWCNYTVSVSTVTVLKLSIAKYHTSVFDVI